MNGRMMALICASLLVNQVRAEEVIPLHKAVDDKKVDVTVVGLGGSTGDTIQITVQRRTADSVRLTLAPGTTFKSSSGRVQDMAGAVIKGERVGESSYRPADKIMLTDDREHSYIIEAYCLNFHKDNPGQGDSFIISAPDARAAALISAGKKSLASVKVIQSALWVQRDGATASELEQRFPVNKDDITAAHVLLQSVEQEKPDVVSTGAITGSLKAAGRAPDARESDLPKGAAAGATPRISAKCTLLQDSLGIGLTKPSSVSLEIANPGTQALVIGEDMFLSFEDGKCSGAVLVSGKNGKIEESDGLPFASGAFIRTCVENEMIKGMGFVTGDFLVLSGGFTGYQGTWPTNLLAARTAKITQRLMLWPENKKGWFASPVLKASGSSLPGFRLLGWIDDPSTPAVRLPMTVNALKDCASDKSNALPLREWAVGWLAALPEEEGWKTASAILSEDTAEIELRKAAARWMATESTSGALYFVNKVMWDKATPGELQLTCYYSLTWSKHPEAKPLLETAASHPNSKISTDAGKRKP